jgi:GGDEF domain-containing protein
MAGLTERRRRAAKSFSVLTLVPQLISGELLGRPEHALVAACLDEQLRAGDSYCPTADGAYVIVLKGTTDEHAPSVAHRIAGELMTRSVAIRRRNWHVGVATYPRDAQTEAALIRIARENALRDQRMGRSKYAS